MPLVHALATIARRRPASVALAWRGTHWTYDELVAAASRVAANLERRNLGAGARVALLLRNSPHYVAVYFGALAAGLVAVPLNVQERARVLATHIADCDARLLIGDVAHPEWEPLAELARQRPVEVIALPLREGDASRQFLHDPFSGADGGAGLDCASDERALASIIYTSGTTGQAKGVMLSHANLLANARAIVASLGLTEHDHSLCVLPFHFSYGNSVLHSHLLAGARLTLEDNLAFPQIVLQRLQDERVSGFAGVPSTFALLLARHRFADFDLSSLRYVTQAGGPMPRALLAKLREQLPALRIFLMYGQTEATARLTCLQPADLDRKAGSVGVPIDGVELEIRENDRPVPRGRVGNIFARGRSVMLGYWNNARATEEVLRDGWLDTRDVGYLDEEGYLFIVGRTSDMIKVGAFRVSPTEIEEVIMALDGVAEAGVVGIADDVLGQAVKAVVVLRPGAAHTPMAVKAHCRESLAGYKVPKVVEFAPALPRTSSGKLQRFKLALENGSA
jgi:long-chain acyl-CoA synthetase